MKRYAVTIEDCDETFACGADQSVLNGMVHLGRRGIPAGCRGGGCGVCKVEVRTGRYEAQVMSRQHVSEDDLQAGRVLACRIRPLDDLRIRVIGKMKKAVCGGPSR